MFDLDALRQGIPDEAYKPLAGDDRETARYFAARNRSEKAGQGTLDLGTGQGRLPPPRALRALPEDSVEEIEQKQSLVRAGEADPGCWRWRVGADLYVAAFLTPKTGGVPANRNTVTVPTTGHVWAELSGQQVYGPLMERAQDLAGEARAFHWPLEFPEVFDAGGFDVVLGNPPWERVKLQEQEFFASRDPEISAAPNAAARGRLIAALKAAAPGSRERRLYDEFEAAKRLAETSSVFARVPGDEGGRFPFTGRGDINTYALFAELFLRLAGPRGRAGVIVPIGISTDTTTAPFFSALVESKRLASLFAFENEAFIFPSVHHAFKFGLLTTSTEPNSNFSFAFFIRHIGQLPEPERRFNLSAAQLAEINPNTKTAPIFRSRADADLTARIYGRVPVLIDETRGREGNSWGLSIGTMFHMSNDSGLFRTSTQLRAEGFEHDGIDWVSLGITPRRREFDLAGVRDAPALDLVAAHRARGRVTFRFMKPR